MWSSPYINESMGWHCQVQGKRVDGVSRKSGRKELVSKKALLINKNNALLEKTMTVGFSFVLLSMFRPAKSVDT